MAPDPNASLSTKEDMGGFIREVNDVCAFWLPYKQEPHIIRYFNNY